MKLSYFTFISLSIVLSNVKAADVETQVQPSAPLTEADIAYPDPDLYMTDFAAIEATANQVDQTSSVDPSARPNQKPAATEVTAIDGQLTQAGTASSKKRSTSPQALKTRFNKGNIVNLKSEERGINDYIKVFDATTSPKDASIQGTAYLTYKLVSNSTTYNNGLNECLSFCDSVTGCRFANLYYEFNNALYDWVFSEKSNLACALYGDVHTAAEKTNFGGQQLKPLPHDLTYITRSTGWAKEAPFTPQAPAGYVLSFDPIDRAVNQGSSLGFSTLSNYDVAACANICNNRAADPVLGACQSFNIWRVLVDKLPTTYVCQLYAAPIGLESATYSGSGNQEITLSRAYNRIQVAPSNRVVSAGQWSKIGGAIASGFASFSHDGGFNSWSYYNGYIAHYSNFNPSFISSVPQYGSVYNSNAFQTIPGRRYTVQFWYHQEATPNAFFVNWNGVNIYTAHDQARAIGSAWTPITFTVTASGNDHIYIGGGGFYTYLYISDFSLFLTS